MPRIALVCACLVGACSFEADYTQGTFYCRDNPACPNGLTCQDGVCREPRMDAATDAPGDVMPDGRPPALTCVEPGTLLASVPASGTTQSRDNLMWSYCSGALQNGSDAVFRLVTTGPNQQLTVSIDGPLSAYVLSPCTEKSNMACLGGTVARDGQPIAVTAPSQGSYFIVVDSLTGSGEYTLTVTVQ